MSNEHIAEKELLKKAESLLNSTEIEETIEEGFNTGKKTSSELSSEMYIEPNKLLEPFTV